MVVCDSGDYQQVGGGGRGEGEGGNLGLAPPLVRSSSVEWGASQVEDCVLELVTQTQPSHTNTSRTNTDLSDPQYQY